MKARARLRVALAAAASVAAACSGGEGSGAAARPDPGNPAPAFEAVSLQGDTVSLESLRGAPVLLNLWATWCPPCRAETPYLQSLHERFGPRGLQVVGVTVDSRAARKDVEAFVVEYGVTYRILHDPSMRSMDLFSVFGLPATYVIGADGTILLKRPAPVMEGDPELEGLLEEVVGEVEAP